MKNWIPNAITLLNLLCGCAAVVCILDHEFSWAAWLLLGAIIFDFADGLVARLLNVSSEHGKELDSLADMVSFGLVPGMIYYVLLDLYFTGANTLEAASTHSGFSWLPLAGFLVTLFSALRLAKFNLDTRQHDDFIGLATPSSTLYTVGLMLIFSTDAMGWGKYILSPWVLFPSILLLSGLLISEIPMFSFKIKGFGWQGNEIRFIFAASILVLLLLLGLAAPPFIVLVYLLLNIGATMGRTRKTSA
ncbi:MAG: CDP-alcohol phosphatidyltransferase family protein [Bacteroidota bacterium]